jgi:protein-tyrosine phosphatase
MKKNYKFFEGFSDWTIMYGDYEPTEIVDKVYLGNVKHSQNKSILEKLQISSIIDISNDNVTPIPFIEYLTFNVDDQMETNIHQFFKPTFEFINKSLENNKAVLVHCTFGISRSPTLVTSYLMKQYSWSLEKSLKFIKEKREVIFPNEGFMSQLIEFEKELFGKNSISLDEFLLDPEMQTFHSN